MLSLTSRTRIWLSRDPVDLRKAFDGLSTIVSERFHRDPYGGDVFVFFNRRRNRVKLLAWDGNGFWLHYKRLERGTFEALSVPTTAAESIAVDRAKLLMLLEGIDTKKSKFRRHFSSSIRIRNSDGRTGRQDHGRAS